MAIRATTGEIRILGLSGEGAGGVGAATVSTRGGAGSGGPVRRAIAPGNPSVSSSQGAFGGGASGGGTAADIEVSIRAIGASTGTVSPSFARISTITPAAGEGISASTLSEEISTSGWSLATMSPALTSHLATTPSITLSPSWGMTTSTRICLTPFPLMPPPRFSGQALMNRGPDPLQPGISNRRRVCEWLP